MSSVREVERAKKSRSTSLLKLRNRMRAAEETYECAIQERLRPGIWVTLTKGGGRIPVTVVETSGQRVKVSNPSTGNEYWVGVYFIAELETL